MRTETITAHLNALTSSRIPDRKKLDEHTATAHELITANAKLAVHIARRYASSEEAFEEALGVANVGLVKATRTFDAEQGGFASWAGRYITAELRNTRQDVLGKSIRKRKGSDLPRMVTGWEVTGDETFLSSTPTEFARAMSTSDDPTDALHVGRVVAAAGGLPKGEAEVVRLALDGHNFSEIGVIRGRSQQSSRQAYIRAVARMQAQVGAA